MRPRSRSSSSTSSVSIPPPPRILSHHHPADPRHTMFVVSLFFGAIAASMGPPYTMGFYATSLGGETALYVSGGIFLLAFMGCVAWSVRQKSLHSFCMPATITLMTMCSFFMGMLHARQMATNQLPLFSMILNAVGLLLLSTALALYCHIKKTNLSEREAVPVVVVPIFPAPVPTRT